MREHLRQRGGWRTLQKECKNFGGETVRVGRPLAKNRTAPKPQSWRRLPVGTVIRCFPFAGLRSATKSLYTLGSRCRSN